MTDPRSWAEAARDYFNGETAAEAIERDAALLARFSVTNSSRQALISELQPERIEDLDDDLFT